jgi:hypothetical protein
MILPDLKGKGCGRRQRPARLTRAINRESILLLSGAEPQRMSSNPKDRQVTQSTRPAGILMHSRSVKKQLTRGAVGAPDRFPER